MNQNLASYLRFSYFFEKTALNSENESYYPEIQFDINTKTSKEELKNELIQLLNRIFDEERHYSDSAFLSSGVDSSLLAFGLRARKTFSVAYEEEDFDESILANNTAEILGSEHHIIKISPTDYLSIVDESMKIRGLPTGDASYIALYFAAKSVSQFTNVVYSGEGPDELFCGYHCYSKYYNNPIENYWIKANTIMDVGIPPIIPNYNGNGFLKMNAFDLTKWMQGNILPNVYSAAKGAGITIRTPYLQPDLISFALSVPPEYKADHNIGKIIFREAAEQFVGHELAFREKKGFPVPVRKWMRSKLYKTQITDSLTSSLASKVFSGIEVIDILRKFYSEGDDSVWKQIWEMYVLVRWMTTLEKNNYHEFDFIL